MSIRLAIDTSGPEGAVGLFADDRVLDRVELVAPKGFGAVLAKAVETLLVRHGVVAANLERITVALGPGSFAGTRIGVSFAKGVAFATKATLVGVTSPGALTFDLTPENDAVAMIDAGRGHAYVGFAGELMFGPDDEARTFVLSRSSRARVLVGNAAARFSDLGEVLEARRIVDVVLLDAAGKNAPLVPPEDLVPAYVQPPRITVPRAK